MPPNESAAPAASPAIEIRGLSKSYGPVAAVRGLTLEVARGEIFAFLGLNGAGKTTTIRTLLDLIRPDTGSCRIFGLDCQAESRLARRRIGYLPGELSLLPHMTGEGTLDLLGRLGGATVSRAYRDELLERLELTHADLRRRIREYSTGMKRKLGLVQALQADPELLILDEPTEGLDPLVQRALNELLFNLRGRGRTIFMSSHVLSEVERTCDRLGVLRQGELVLTTTVQEARRLGGRIVRVTFDGQAPDIPLSEPFRVIEKTDGQWTIAVRDEIGVLFALLAPYRLKDVEVEEPALEDVLRHFYREGEA